MSQRFITWSILLALPVVVLLGWFVTERAPAWMPTVPGWLRPTSQNPAPGACEALAAVDGYGGRFINFFQPSDIPSEDVPEHARALIDFYADTGSSGEIGLSQPTLVQASFPGVGERFAWLVIATLPGETDARFDRAAIAFVDADSGDLLALNVATSVVDVRTACGNQPVSRRELVRQYLPLLLTGAYSGLVAFGLLVRFGWRRRKA